MSSMLRRVNRTPTYCYIKNENTSLRIRLSGHHGRICEKPCLQADRGGAGGHCYEGERRAAITLPIATRRCCSTLLRRSSLTAGVAYGENLAGRQRFRPSPSLPFIKRGGLRRLSARTLSRTACGGGGAGRIASGLATRRLSPETMADGLRSPWEAR